MLENETKRRVRTARVSGDVDESFVFCVIEKAHSAFFYPLQHETKIQVVKSLIDTGSVRKLALLLATLL